VTIDDNIVREERRFDFQELALVEEPADSLEHFRPAAEHVERGGGEEVGGHTGRAGLVLPRMIGIPSRQDKSCPTLLPYKGGGVQSST
jgi:hypothetical protein